MVCLVKPDETSGVSTLSQHCAAVHPVLREGSPTIGRLAALSLGNQPVSVRFFSSPRVASVVANLTSSDRFDVIHVETYYMFFNLAQIRNLPLVLVESNVEYRLQEGLARNADNLLWKLALHMDSRKQRIWEWKAWRLATVCAGVTDADSQSISRITGKKAFVVENGINSCDLRVEHDLQPPFPRILFLGTLLYRPNVDAVLFFIREILPLIRAVFPSVELHIVGEHPNPVLLRYHAPPGVTFRGFVMDLEPIFQETLLSICPVRAGGGSRHEDLRCRI